MAAPSGPIFQSVHAGPQITIGQVGEIDGGHRELLQRIWAVYADEHDTPDLLGLTHLPGTPWDTVYRSNSWPSSGFKVIPGYLVRGYFLDGLSFAS